MRTRVLLAVDALLVIAVAVLGVQLYEAWRTEPTVAAPSEAVKTPEPAPAALPTPRIPTTELPTVAMVAERNLFNPNRIETAPEPVRAVVPPPPPAPKPRLYGIVLPSDGKARAYLEDTQRHRVLAYSTGDRIGDSSVQQIQADRVVLQRSGEVFEVLLRDPSKPKAAEPVPGASGQAVPPRVTPETTPADGPTAAAEARANARRAPTIRRPETDRVQARALRPARPLRAARPVPWTAPAPEPSAPEAPAEPEASEEDSN